MLSRFLWDFFFLGGGVLGAGSVGVGAFVIGLSQSSSFFSVVTSTDRPKLVRHRCVIELFDCVFGL